MVSEQLQQFADVKVLRRLLIPAQEREEEAQMKWCTKECTRMKSLCGHTPSRRGCAPASEIYITVYYRISQYTTGEISQEIAATSGLSVVWLMRWDSLKCKASH